MWELKTNKRRKVCNFLNMVGQDTLHKLSVLLIEGKEFEKHFSYLHSLESMGRSTSDYADNSFLSSLIKWQSEALNIISLRFTRDSPQFSRFLSSFSQDYLNQRKLFSWDTVEGDIIRANAILGWIVSSLKEGFVDDVFYKKELEVFSTMLDQAYEFHKNNLLIAAAVYGRVIVETTLREFYEIKVGKKFLGKFDALIIDLKTLGHITKPFEGSLRANYAIGNQAAHNDPEFSKLTNKDILDFLNFIRDKVLILS